jgi:hypothetical protein
MDFIVWIEEALDKSKKPFYYFILLVHFLYFVTYFGLFVVHPETLSWLDTITQVFVCLFLLIRFNPLREREPIQIEKYDRKLLFGSGVLLFSNLIAIKIANYLNITRVISL